MSSSNVSKNEPKDFMEVLFPPEENAKLLLEELIIAMKSAVMKVSTRAREANISRETILVALEDTAAYMMKRRKEWENFVNPPQVHPNLAQLPIGKTE